MDERALSLMKQMLKINPSERISIKDALKHPFFNDFHSKEKKQHEKITISY